MINSDKKGFYFLSGQSPSSTFLGSYWSAVAKLYLQWDLRRRGRLCTLSGQGAYPSEHGVNLPAFVSLNPQQNFEKVLFHGPLLPTILMKDVGKSVPGLAELMTRSTQHPRPQWTCGFIWAARGAGKELGGAACSPGQWGVVVLFLEAGAGYRGLRPFGNENHTMGH